MKRVIMTTAVVVGIGTVVGVAFYMGQQSEVREKGGENTELSSIRSAEPTRLPQTVAVKPKQLRPSNTQVNEGTQLPDDAHQATTETPAPADSSTAKPGTVLFRQAVDCLLSPQSGFAQREAALSELRDSGHMDQAIGELEQHAANDANSPECAAALGRLYLQKAGTIQDVREQGILAMKADQVFDAALNLEPDNWEARFTKAVAMSYWPTQMNKGIEVMQHFVTLIEQQEAQAPQPQFAQTYVWLGKEYQKYGYTADAKEIWQRGAALFPEDQELRAKLEGR